MTKTEYSTQEVHATSLSITCDSIRLAEAIAEPRYKRFVENKHRRGYGGKFSQKESTTVTPQQLAGAIQKLDVGEYIDIPGGKGKVKRLKKGYQVVAGNGTLNKVFKDVSDAVNASNRIASGRVGKKNASKDTTRYGGS